MGGRALYGTIPAVLVVGVLTIGAYYLGRGVRHLRMPGIIGFMIVGIVLGPSVLNIVDAGLEQRLSFITRIALGFVALSIGIELRISWLRKQGHGIVLTILGQCFAAFIVVGVCVYAVESAVSGQLSEPTHILALALILGALATATAPAGTVAVIREYRAKGNLTQTLYAVVGYDDALAVVIFGFCLASARALLLHETGGGAPMHFGLTLLTPLREVVFSLAVGTAVGALFCVLARNLRRAPDMLILLVGFVLIANGLSAAYHLSFILTNMVFGFIVANTHSGGLLDAVNRHLERIMPLCFVLLFALAGANLHLGLVPRLGVLGLVYVVARSIGKTVGAWSAAKAGKLEAKIRKYLGMALLSQAGVAIGLAVVARHELRGLGKNIGVGGSVNVTSGDVIGSVVLTTIMATSVFFEIVGPILAKVALDRAGEISTEPENEPADV